MTKMSVTYWYSHLYLGILHNVYLTYGSRLKGLTIFLKSQNFIIVCLGFFDIEADVLELCYFFISVSHLINTYFMI